MQKQSAIRWRKSDEQELDKAIKRFNAKIYRERKKSPDKIPYLPDTIKKKDLKEKIRFRKDFKRELNSMSRFSQKNSTDLIKSKTGNTVTKWEKKEVSLMVASVNRKRSAERKKYDVERPNMQMGTIRQNELRPKTFNFDKIRKGKEWELFKSSIEKELDKTDRDKAELYKRNYLKAIEGALGVNADRLYDFIVDIPAEQLYEKYWEDDDVIKIGYVYDPQDAIAIADNVIERWQLLLSD